MFQLFKGKRNEKRSLKLPPGLSKKDQRRVQEVIDRAKKNDGIPRTAQQSIPFDRMFPDGICRIGSFYTKTIQFQDINYQLAQQEDKTAIFEEWCGFLNFFDSSIHFELSFMNMTTDAESFEAGIRIPYRKDAFNSVRDEYSEMLKNQLAQGNNGLTKTKFLTFGIEADSMKQAKPRLEHVQNDLLNNFKQLGVRAEVLNGYERLKLMHDMSGTAPRTALAFAAAYAMAMGSVHPMAGSSSSFRILTNCAYLTSDLFMLTSYIPKRFRYCKVNCSTTGL